MFFGPCFLVHVFWSKNVILIWHLMGRNNLRCMHEFLICQRSAHDKASAQGSWLTAHKKTHPEVDHHCQSSHPNECSGKHDFNHSILISQLSHARLVSTGADASSEGVQRDLLPIIEGSVVSTKYGNVNTDHILFICSGAFHSCKPSDMLAELQGRLPIRVELKGLT
jgi:hypothetical protein